MERILIEDGRATGVVLAKTGEVHRAKAIISNADLRRNFLDLMGKEHLPEDFARQIEAIKPATSTFIVYLGVDFVPDVEPLTMSVAGVGIMTARGQPPHLRSLPWSTGGSIYDPVWDAFRPPLKSPMPGLYLVRYGVFPGPGIEAVVISGVLAADAIHSPKKLTTKYRVQT